MEQRLLLAFLLMGAVLFFSPYFLPKPPTPPAKKVESPKPTAQQSPGAPEVPAAAAKPVIAPVQGVVTAGKQEEITVETDVYRIRFSNLGATVRSWQLKAYKDANGKTLELVNPMATGKLALPLSLTYRDKGPGVDLDKALYVVRRDEDGLGLSFEYADGKVVSRKSIRFRKNSYLAKLGSELLAGGAPVSHYLCWRGGFGDRTIHQAHTVQRSLFYDAQQSKLVANDASAAKDGPVAAGGRYTFAGVEDPYFAAVALPATGTYLEIQTWSDMVRVDEAAKDEEWHVGAAVGGQAVNSLWFFVGPKDVDVLRAINPKLELMLDWGWFWWLAKPLFSALHWLHDKYLPNYGWSIVVITVAINFLLLPLKFTSLKSMKKMAEIQPQIAAINEKYKSLSLRDPRKAEQNQEVMDLYKKHGVNPMGGCMPMLLQIPFFIAFYKVLSVAIELRGASWLWVSDLSQPETLAIKILPLAMIATQFILQKMTPSTSPDPAQQRIMLLMPLMLGFMFYNVSSGLVLYWLTGNVVGIAQQWFFNRLAPAPVAVQKPPQKKKSGRN